MTDQLQTLKTLLGIKDNQKDAVLCFLLAKAGDMICNYCRIQAVPSGLERVLLSMCVDLYRAECYGQEKAEGVVRSISEGKVAVAFASATSSAEDEGMAFLRDYTGQLNRYRKAGW